MLRLASDAVIDDTVMGMDVTFVFYSGEEVAREHSGLLKIEAADPDLLRADAAILGEPTDGVVEAGCQGVLKLGLTVKGHRAHTARPWTGTNALHRLGPILEKVARFDERMPLIDGCRYHESLQAVRAEGGIAANVVPDEATLVLSHRFAPDRDEQQAKDALEAWLRPCLDSQLGDSYTYLDTSPAAAPNLGHPVLKALVDSSGSTPRAKLGWTDVAYFSERGIPAANFGPGDPEVAHTATEFVTRSQLERVYDSLSQLLFPTATR
jgi:succinyl-diaminopimelate desuccinylase